MARKGAGAPPPMDLDDRAENVLEWIQANSRAVALGVVVVLAVGVGAWLYMRTQSIRQERAAEALTGAQEALAVQNVPLAVSDLERVLTRYDGTRAADQAAVILAQVHFDQGRYEEGLRVLDEHASSPPDYLAAPVDALRGAGHEQLRRFAEAAQHYERAADRARFEADRDTYLASAARVHGEAGNTQRAREIWRRLAEDPRSPVAAEARVRLGELEAVPASAG